jgi:hypothetical protein
LEAIIVKRLNIVVPYRAREAHLQQFVPHLRAYFSRDKIDHRIPYRALIVEQENGLPFNRGALKNIGFVLGREDSDYTVFHDVDYLPIWADYTWADTPTAIIWYGAEVRPIVPGRPEIMQHDMNQFFGAVLLTPNALFAQVNGFSNLYWGWGFEDMDLTSRFDAANIKRNRRKGTFHPLPHANEGVQLDFKPTPIAKVNQEIFRTRWMVGNMPSADGLSEVAFEILNRRAIPEGPNPERSAPWEMVTVRLNMRPGPAQLEAIANSGHQRG